MIAMRIVTERCYCNNEYKHNVYDILAFIIYICICIFIYIVSMSMQAVWGVITKYYLIANTCSLTLLIYMLILSFQQNNFLYVSKSLIEKKKKCKKTNKQTNRTLFYDCICFCSCSCLMSRGRSFKRVFSCGDNLKHSSSRY